MNLNTKLQNFEKETQKKDAAQAKKRVIGLGTKSMLFMKNKPDFIKIKNICPVKDLTKKMKT